MSQSMAVVTTFVAQTLRMSVPYACAAMAGVVCERGGVVNIALEGMLLMSALSGVAFHLASGNPLVGLFCGILVGALMGWIHGLFVVRGKVDAIISGLALNLVAAGGTRALLRALYDSSSNSPTIAAFRMGGLGGGTGAHLFLRTVFDPLFVLMLSVAAGLSWALSETRLGVHLRACGENPKAAATVGIPVARLRMGAAAMSGAVAGIGGVALAYDLHQFQAGMSGGRGFIALAAVILSGWQILPSVFACVAFAGLDAMQVALQDSTTVSPNLIQMLPFVATLLVLFIVGLGQDTKRRSPWTPPAGLGKPLDG